MVSSKEYSRAYYLAHRDHLLERAREHYAAHREQKREHSRESRRNGRAATALAKQLQRGEQVRNAYTHHAGMAKLKEMLGNPRPEGLQLSLVNQDSPDTYWGYHVYRGEQLPYRLSTNPADYAWETPAENTARRDSKWSDESVTSQ